MTELIRIIICAVYDFKNAMIWGFYDFYVYVHANKYYYGPIMAIFSSTFFFSFFDFPHISNLPPQLSDLDQIWRKASSAL